MSKLPVYKIKDSDLKVAPRGSEIRVDDPDVNVSDSGTTFKKGAAPKIGVSGEEKPGKQDSRLTPAGGGNRSYKGDKVSSSGGTQGIWNQTPIKQATQSTADTTSADLSRDSNSIRVDKSLGDNGKIPYMGGVLDNPKKKIRENEEDSFSLGSAKDDAEQSKQTSDDSAAEYKIKDKGAKMDTYIKASELEKYVKLYPELGRKGQELINNKEALKFGSGKDSEDYYRISKPERFEKVSNDSQLVPVKDPTYSFKDKENQLRSNLDGATPEEKREIMSKWKETDPEKRKNLSASENSLNWDEAQSSRDEKQSKLDKGSNRELPEKPKGKAPEEEEDEPEGMIDLSPSKEKQNGKDFYDSYAKSNDPSVFNRKDTGNKSKENKTAKNRPEFDSKSKISTAPPTKGPEFKTPVSKAGNTMKSLGTRNVQVRESKVMNIIRQVIKEEINRK